MTGVRQQSNFSQLKAHDEQLERLGLLAERYFADDPNTCLLKLRQLAEGMAQSVASRVGIYTSADERQIDLLRRLQDHGILPREIGGLFHEVRKAGNDANHNLAGDHRMALMAMRLSWQLGIWFHRTFKEPGFKPGPFIPPTPPADESVELKVELETLQKELITFRTAHQDATQALEATQARVQQTEEERAFWETMATEAETANTAAATLKLIEADSHLVLDGQGGIEREYGRKLGFNDFGRQVVMYKWDPFPGYRILHRQDSLRANRLSGAVQGLSRRTGATKPQRRTRRRTAGPPEGQCRGSFREVLAPPTPGTEIELTPCRTLSCRCSRCCSSA